MNRFVTVALRSATRKPSKSSSHLLTSPILSLLPTASVVVPNNNNNITLSSSLTTDASTRSYSSTTPTLTKNVESNTNKSPEEIEAMIKEELEKMEAQEQMKQYQDWKPGYRKRPLVLSYDMDDFENEGKMTKWLPQLHKRCGALGIKVGMMPVWDEWGERHACTVLYLDNNVVIRTFREEEDGYTAVQMGAGERKKKNVTKPLMGHFEKYGVDEMPPYIVREFRVSHTEYLPEPGTKIHARHFVPGQNVDVSAISKGKGFQGAMKLWNFGGMPASHGTSLSHRALGSVGQCQDPGRVFKGKKMAGRMGSERVTTQNLRIVKVDRGRNLLYIKGPVPGQKGGFVEIRDAVKRPLFGTSKVQDESIFPPLPTFDFEDGIDGSGQGGYEVMMPQQDIDPFDPPMDEAA